jgi:hypothetical protein
MPKEILTIPVAIYNAESYGEMRSQGEPYQSNEMLKLGCREGQAPIQRWRRGILLYNENAATIKRHQINGS